LKLRISKTPSVFVLVTAAVGAAVVMNPSGRFAQSRTAKAFRAVVAEHEGNAVVEKFALRAALTDELCEILLDSMPAKRPEQSGSAVAASSHGDASASALRVLNDHKGVFVFDVVQRSVENKALSVLSRHCDFVAAEAQRRLVRRARQLVEAGDAQHGEVIALCLVIPFLCTKDESWTAASTDMLPEWIKQADHLDHAEWFALRAERPLTAYALSASKITASGSVIAPLVSYLTAASRRLVRAGEFAGGIGCLRAGVSTFERRGAFREAAALRFQLVEVFEQMGQAVVAAKEMKEVLDGPYEDEDWSKAAVLRLKLLFRTLEYDKVVKEADMYIATLRAEAALPSLCYVKWLALVRIGETQGALETRTVFLERFPEHPLAADIHFAIAMEDLSTGEYDAALARLEGIIEYFPQARSASRSKEIIERLSENVRKPK